MLLQLIKKEMMKREPMEEQEEKSDGDEDEEGQDSNIILHSTSEFCRTLGEIPTYGQSGNRQEDIDELMVSTDIRLIIVLNIFSYCTFF